LISYDNTKIRKPIQTQIDGICCNLNGGHWSPEIGGPVQTNISNMLKAG